MAHILVVDDDDIVAEHAANTLMNAGHACGWVSDAKEALKVLGKRRPDLMLLDHNMPGETGTMLLRRLRSSPQFYDLPVVMLTGMIGFKEEQIALYSGAQDYIRKPFGEKMLVYRVNQILKKRGKRSGHQSLSQRVGVEAAPLTSTPIRMIG